MMFAMFRRVERVTTNGALLIAMLCLVVLSGSCFYQVIARFIIHESLAWSEAISTLLMTWTVFLALPAAFREGAMISVDIIPSIVGKDKLWLVTLIAGLTIVLLAISAWYGLQILPRVQFQRVAGLNISIMWGYLAIPVGAILAIPAVIVETVESLKANRIDNSLEIGL